MTEILRYVKSRAKRPKDPRSSELVELLQLIEGGIINRSKPKKRLPGMSLAARPRQIVRKGLGK